MKQATLFAIIIALAVVAVSAPFGSNLAKGHPRKGHNHQVARTATRRRTAVRAPMRAARSKASLKKKALGFAIKRGSAERCAAATDKLNVINARYLPPSPEELLVMQAESRSEHAIADLLKAGDLVSAMAECRSAMAASAVAHGGVAVPRLRHLLGATYLTAGRYADAYRVFEDIGHHNGEMYVCDDFEMDVALAAANVGNLRQAESLVGWYLRRFQNWEGRADLLPGFATQASAIASVRAVRGVNKVCTAQWDEGAAELGPAAQVAPNNAYIADIRGTALSFLGRFGEAEACLEGAARSGIDGLSMHAELQLASVRAAARKAAANGK